MIIERIYEAYPRHIGRRKALLEIDRALRRIAKKPPHLNSKSDLKLRR